MKRCLMFVFFAQCVFMQPSSINAVDYSEVKQWALSVTACIVALEVVKRVKFHLDEQKFSTPITPTHQTYNVIKQELGEPLAGKPHLFVHNGAPVEFRTVPRSDLDAMGCDAFYAGRSLRYNKGGIIVLPDRVLSHEQNQLAYVTRHEIGHAKHDHAALGICLGMFIANTTALSLSLENPTKLSIAIGLFAFATFVPSIRRQEQQADYYAIANSKASVEEINYQRERAQWIFSRNQRARMESAERLVQSRMLKFLPCSDSTKKSIAESTVSAVQVLSSIKAHFFQTATSDKYRARIANDELKKRGVQ